ncbi:related to tRNA isopentenyltransferase [Rhynchosporium agropyri]|uniref:tRNA dimethylallyltransferase n=1 Tax=Rhynchosporium agropyri TaxID=914238 RepID=A0A1E1K6Q4_9HELO|nr:related to tRNA isopentenyltransferase [Rhynchosporium agropyri]
MLRRAYGFIVHKVMIKRPPKSPLIIVLGATGTGKSQLAVDMARRFDGEIINGDAMQMYDGLPIITNKVTLEEQQGIPHHLLGFVGLEEEPWRVGKFKQKAGQIIREIRSRGRLPILVGGTHYYTQTLLFDETLVTPIRELENQIQGGLTDQELEERYPILRESTENLMARLREVDPIMADRWHPKDRRKIRRSLEIFLTTGKKASDTYAEQKERRTCKKLINAEKESVAEPMVDIESVLLFWVYAEHEILKKRLDARIDKMVDAGLLDEVKSMELFLQSQTKLGIEVDRGRGIWVSIGYKEFEPYLKALDSATASNEEVQSSYELSVEHTKIATRQYARQQVRWIRTKLLPALSEVNADNNLYLVDGSDVSKFSETVAHPAIKIAESFLKGTERVAPRDLCAAAAKILDPEEVADVADPYRQECELCHVVVLADHQWQMHLNSRRHKALLKKKHKDERSGRKRPPPMDSRSGSDI